MAFMLLEGSHLNTHVLPEILAPPRDAPPPPMSLTMASLLRARTPAAMLLCRRTLQPLQPLLHRRAMSSAPPPPSPSKAAASTGSVIEITNPAEFEVCHTGLELQASRLQAGLLLTFEPCLTLGSRS